MAVKIYYQEDYNLALLRKNNCDYRIRKSGACSCVEFKRIHKL